MARHLSFRLLCLAAVLAGGAAGPALAAAGAAAPDPLPQPRLDDGDDGLPGQAVPASRWWATLKHRDAWGPASLDQAVRGVPGLVASPAPGNGSLGLMVLHGRAQPALSLAGVTLPGQPPLLPALFDSDLLLVAGPAGDAGRIALSLRRPGDRLAGLGEVAAGAFGSLSGLARIDMPMASGVRLGLGGALQSDRGWLTNVTTGERLNRGQRAGLSGTLDLDLAPQLTLALTGVYARSNAGNLPAFACSPLDAGHCDGRFASTGQRAQPPLASWGPLPDDLAQQPLGQRADLGLGSARLAWGDAHLSLALTGQLARQSGHFGLDLGDGRALATLAQPAGLPTGGYGIIARTEEDSEGLGLEGKARLGALALTLAADWRASRSWRHQADTAAGVLIADRKIRQDHDRTSLFAQARWQAAPGLSLLAGVRVARERLALGVRDRRDGCAPCLVNAGPQDQRQTLVTPEIAIGWRPGGEDGAVLLFARSARSARLPGWNLLARTTAELQLLPAETGWQHEAGLKADLFGGQLRVNGTGFVARTAATLSPLLGIDPLAMAVAAGQRLDMRNHGIDLVVTARPLAALDLSGSLGWQQARWQGVVPAGAPARPLYAPDVTASLSAAWHQPLAGTGAVLVPRVAATWRSAMAVAAGPVLGLAGAMAPAGWEVAAAVQLEIPDGGWLVSLECRNCLDATLTTGAVAGLPTLNAPRWWQVRFTRRF